LSLTRCRLFEPDGVPTVIEKAAVVIEKQQETLARVLLQKAKNESHLQRAKLDPEKLKRIEKKMAKNGDDIEKKTNQRTQRPNKKGYPSPSMVVSLLATPL
jgi:hypothetical protein